MSESWGSRGFRRGSPSVVAIQRATTSRSVGCVSDARGVDALGADELGAAREQVVGELGHELGMSLQRPHALADGQARNRAGARTGR